jgi:uncharacterized phage-like protein YoqJ
MLLPLPKTPKLYIAVTGHRPDKLGGYNESNPIAVAVKRHMKEYLGKFNPEETMVISGMALGVDQWWAETAIELGIPFIAAIPFFDMEHQWPQSSKDRFNRILKCASDVTYICKPGYEAWKMQERNKWMVNYCDELVAYWNGSAGGTANCVQYAQQIGKIATIFDPRMLT